LEATTAENIQDWNAVKRAIKINKAITANSHHREEFTQELISHAIVTAGREI